MVAIYIVELGKLEAIFMQQCQHFDKLRFLMAFF